MAAGPGVFFRDTFAGQVGLLTAHAPDIGGQWRRLAIALPVDARLNGAGQCVTDPGDDLSSIHYNAQVAPNRDYDVTAVVELTDDAVSTARFSFFAAFSVRGTADYEGWGILYDPTVFPTKLLMQRREAGVTSFQGSVNLLLGVGLHTLRFEMREPALTKELFVDGVLQIASQGQPTSFSPGFVGLQTNEDALFESLTATDAGRLTSVQLGLDVKRAPARVVSY